MVGTKEIFCMMCNSIIRQAVDRTDLELEPDDNRPPHLGA